MRPQIENIEARSAETIFQALRDRIPRYLREWDDYNESDPGIALLQLFAVVGEGLSHQLSRLPGELQAELLSLVGLKPHPALPAQADRKSTRLNSCHYCGSRRQVSALK